MGYTPLTLSKALRRPLGTALVVLSVLVLAYSVLITARILSGVLFVALVVLGYLGYRLIRAIEALADGYQRLADAREHEAFSRSGRLADDVNDANTPSDVDRSRDDDPADAKPGT